MKKFIVLRKSRLHKDIFYRTISSSFTTDKNRAYRHTANNKEEVLNKMKWDAEVFEIEEIEE